MLKSFTSPEIQQLVIRFYLNGYNCTQIASKVGCCISTCRNILNKYNIKKRTRSEARRKLKVNDHFFSDINSEEKAYWLGFITGDGHVYQNKKGNYCSVQIQLDYIDNEHVLKFKNAIKSEHKVSHPINAGYSNHMMSRISVNSQKLATDLVNLGVTPKKSLTILPCKTLPISLYRHYFRGLIDADGTITCDKIMKWSIELGGTLEITRFFRSFIIFNNIYTTAKVTKKKIYHIRYCGTPLTKQICTLLYNNCSIYLNRKYNLYKQLLKQKSRKPRNKTYSIVPHFP